MIITITLNPAVDRTLRLCQPLVPGHLNRAEDSTVEPGGKGINVSRAIKALGGESIALGFSAGSNGRYLKDALTSMDLHHDFVDVPGQTRVNIQIIDNQGDHTEINEPGFPISDGSFLRFLERVEVYLSTSNLFVLSGSMPRNFSMERYCEICKIIKKAGSGLIVDAAGEHLAAALQFEPDFVKPNVFELADAVGDQPSADPEAVLISARKLLDRGAQAVCVSMAQEGAVFVSKHYGEALYLNSNPKIFADGAVGTGDSMVGAIANGIQQGLPFEEMAKFVVAAGRASAGIPGTAMASLKHVFEVYETIETYII